ncbi:MAG: Glutamine amidotransferase class-II [Myxococcaceae bacterium]|nr:Glutamine amidotransferase class-II [Myxococcaceae bacterium]
MAWRVFAGKNDADTLIGEDLQLRRKAPELAQMHFTLLASDFDSPLESEALRHWKPVDDRAIVTLTRGQEPKTEPL